ncbi:MAG: tetratricopeptide (TPR) repeat protein [Sphingobacteriales bacterium]|jgi:tetratricopeptide (TPR) repeat protein
MAIRAFIIFGICLLAGCGNTPESKPAGEKQDPLVAINQIIRNSPNNANLYKERAELELELGMMNEALADVNRSVALDSMNANFHVGKGEVLFAMQKYERAIVSFEKARDIDPENVDAIIRLSQVQLYLRNYDKAMELANEALKVNTYEHIPYYVKAWVFLETGDTIKAVGSFRTAIEVNPEYYDGYMMLGKLYSDAGKDISLEYFQSAFELDTNNVEPLYHQAFFYQRTEKVELAMDRYKKCVQKNPSHVFSWYNQGFLWLEFKDNPDSAFVYFAKAAYVEPKYKEAFFNMGLCRELKGEKDVALGYYKKALAIDPNFDLAIFGLNRMLE